MLGAIAGATVPVHAQISVDSEVRQLVTFRFLPGRAAEALDIYREQAIPLYRQDDAMLNLRVFREVESPFPLDLVVVRGFRGMEGMDESNTALRGLAQQAGTSIGAIYGAIGALSATHDDQFIEMLAPLSNGDPSSQPLVAFIWYRAAPGQTRLLLDRIERDVLPAERREAIPSSTGRFLLTDGWDYLRILGFDSLGDYQSYWADMSPRVVDFTASRREVILAPVPGLSVR